MGGIQGIRSSGDFRSIDILDHNLGGEMRLIWNEASKPPRANKTVILHFGDDLLETGYFDGTNWKFCCGTPPHATVTHWAEFNYPSQEGIE
jgi:hypothetical protein